MCELFGICGNGRKNVTPYLREFFSRSYKHCHGWGIANFAGNGVSLEKEPIMASNSYYLRARMQFPIVATNLIAHIRLASVGDMSYVNCHPFVLSDNRGRTWTLAHNGTIFDLSPLDIYTLQQTGGTDSELILLYLIDQVNRQQNQLGRALEVPERFALVEKVAVELSAGNKLNLLIWDGEVMYAHSNYAQSLYCLQESDALYLATAPLGKQAWSPAPFLHLVAYKEGRILMESSRRSEEYKDDPSDASDFQAVDSAQL